MAQWTADVANDPNQDGDLVLELMEDGEYRARLLKSPDGKIIVEVYDTGQFSMPFAWLEEIVESAKKDVWFDE